MHLTNIICLINHIMNGQKGVFILQNNGSCLIQCWLGWQVVVFNISYNVLSKPKCAIFISLHRSSDSIKATSLKLKLYNDGDHDDITSSDDEDHAPSTVNSSSSTTFKPSSLSSSHTDYRQPVTAAYTLQSETGLRQGGKSNAAVWYLLFSVAVLIMSVLAWYLAQP